MLPIIIQPHGTKWAVHGVTERPLLSASHRRERMRGAPHHIILATAVLALVIGGVEGMMVMERACMSARIVSHCTTRVACC